MWVSLHTSAGVCWANGHFRIRLMHSPNSARFDDHFADLTDPRRRKVVYPLINIVAVAICARTRRLASKDCRKVHHIMTASRRRLRDPSFFLITTRTSPACCSPLAFGMVYAQITPGLNRSKCHHSQLFRPEERRHAKAETTNSRFQRPRRDGARPRCGRTCWIAVRE